MKKLYFKLSFLLLFTVLNNYIYSQSGIFESYLILDSNSSGNVYYDLNASTGNPDFDGSNLGTFILGNSLILNGAQNKTFKCGSDNILNGWLNYRVYEISATPPAFTSVNLSFLSDDPGAGAGCQNQTWEEIMGNINLLSGLPSGDYYIDIYTHADYDTNSDNVMDGTLYSNNSGSNYVASFRVDNPPIASCNINSTIFLDEFGQAELLVSDVDNGSSDDFDAPSLSLSQTYFDCSDLSSSVVVTLTATDSFGQSDTCTSNITILDNSSPIPDTAILPDLNAQCSITLNPPTATDNCSGSIIGTTNNPITYSTQGSYTVTWNYDDGNGNISSQTQNVTISDTIFPEIPTLSTINGECSATATIPSTTDNCSGIIYGTTTDDLSYYTQGAHVIHWNFDDGHGNITTADQTVFINDVTNPSAICQNITVQLSDLTGIVNITPEQLDNGTSDNCDFTLTASQTSFDCSNIGSNVVTLTATDNGGNTDTCTAIVTVQSPNIDGGDVIGYLENTETAADADNLVEVTACPDEPQNGVFSLINYSGYIAYWESSTNGGLTWNSISNNTDSYYFANILQTTLIRAVIQIGSCQAYSSIMYVSVIPPDVPPTIIGPTTFNTCLGTDVTVVAQTEYGIIPDFNEGGMFNEANPEGWSVDGTGFMPAAGNNTNSTTWVETNGPKKFGGKCYDTTDNSKFAIASGIGSGPNSPLTYLETPIFNTLGLTSATLEFEQAYFLNSGSWCKIELSVDSGATYPIELDPGAQYNYTGPSDTGFMNNVPGFTGQCRNTLGTLIDKSVVIDLQNYIGMVGLRIRFTFNGTTGSVWALDNIRIPDAPVDEVLEWTDNNGIVVTTGSSTTITPVTPGMQTYGVTSLINGCRSEGDEGTEFINVNVTLAYAGESITPIVGECGQSTVQLAAYDNSLTAVENYNNGVWNNNYVVPDVSSGDIDYPGTGENGYWSVSSAPVSCSGAYNFSNINSPNSTFTGEEGTYTLTWNIAGCTSDVMVTIDKCDSIDFDGSDDYVDFDNNFNFSSSFSIEVWVKPENVSGTKTILSKRDSGNPSSGYDLKMLNGMLSFNWNNGQTINTAPYSLNTSRWFHIAITKDASGYKLYVDGILIKSANGSSPNVNNQRFILGALSQNISTASNFFNGWLDELRIWNVALSQDQIREMMNQEITNNGGVYGAVLPLNIAGLNWSNLDGYYRMQVACGSLAPFAGNIQGKLRNIYSAQEETAPLPYTSRIDNQNWSTDDTWTNYDVWEAPNSLGIDNSTYIDWNIVEINHHIYSKDNNTTVLGLLSNTPNKKLRISDPSEIQDVSNSGQSLRVTHYLKLNGIIDLVGESQFLQDEGSILDPLSSGYLEKDQQGTANPYNYNYWGSPVSTINGATINHGYSIGNGGVLKDDGPAPNYIPTEINWINGYTATASSPATVSKSWLYKYENNPSGQYSEWEYIGNGGNISAGIGFTMKGSGNAESEENYTFQGKPNNGTISNIVNTGNEILIGNPYASAIDANAFINDNISFENNSITGTLYFWEHFTSNATHITEDYEGGYATYNLSGGNAAISHPDISQNGTASKTPERYIPVGQGFFVEANSTGGNVLFKNSQRAFVRETSGDSQFMRLDSNSNEISNDQIQRLRFQITLPDQAKRPLLLSFLNDDLATNGIDLGYDALNIEEFPNDASWIIENEKFTIQGVNYFNDLEIYPLGLYLNSSGTIEITHTTSENFDEIPNIFLYDSLTNIYHPLNQSNFSLDLDAGIIDNRFFITFQNLNSLSLDSENEVTNELNIQFVSKLKEIQISTKSGIERVELLNLLGQKVLIWNEEDLNDRFIDGKYRIHVNNLNAGGYIIQTWDLNNSKFQKKIICN